MTTMARAGLDRDRIIAEAIALTDEEGFPSLSASVLARRFGVQTASLYSHIRGIDAIRDGVRASALNELADLVEQAVGDAHRGAAIRALFAAHVQYATRFPGRYDAVRTANVADTATRVAGERHSGFLSALIGAYALGEADTWTALRYVSATIRGYTDLLLAGGFARAGSALDEEHLRIADVLHESLERWSARETEAQP